MSTIADIERTPSGLAGKYLTFKLGEEIYGMEILCVQEIIGLLPITRLPRVTKYIRGVINLRGKVIPVMNLARRFDLPDRDDTELTCIIVTELVREDGTITMGIVVDEVSEVVDINAESIEPPPDLGAAIGERFLSGMGKITDKVVILLDVSEVLAPSAQVALNMQEAS